MPLTLYPVAKDAPSALAVLRADNGLRAGREREAVQAAGQSVDFVTEWIGPPYDDRDAGLDACAGLVEDDRKGHIFMPADGDRVCRLVCRPLDQKRIKSRPVAPVFAEGERWPKVTAVPATIWQLSISYWKIAEKVTARTVVPSTDQARKARKSAASKDLNPDEVAALAHTPLAPMRPQKALDFGLFDFPLPENPDIIIADE